MSVSRIGLLLIAQAVEIPKFQVRWIVDRATVMAKGYWITTGTIHTPLAMVPYISQLKAWLPSLGGRVLVMEMASDVREGTPGSLSVVIEFPSLEAAVNAYESDDYQAMIRLRMPHSDLTLSISEEVTS